MIRKKIIFYIYAILIALIMVFILFYLLVGRKIIEAMYKGEFMPIFNIIQGQVNYPLEHYFAIADQLCASFLLFNLTAILIIFIAPETVLVIKKQFFSKLKRIKMGTIILGLIKFKQFCAKNKKLILICLGLFILFFNLYFIFGFLLSKTRAFSEKNILFQSDCPLVIKVISTYRYMHRAEIHPLYKLIIFPCVFLLRNLIHSKIVTALIVNSFFGAVGVVLAYSFFWLFSKNNLNSALLSIIFGLSMSELFFGIVPNFPSLIICSLLTTYILFFVSLSKKRLFFLVWVLAGIFSLGLAVINFTQTLICFVVLIVTLSREKKTEFSNLSEIAGLIISVFFLTASLAIIQTILVHFQGGLFFLPTLFDNFYRYAGFLIFHKPLLVMTALAKHFFMVNFVAPLPGTFVMPKALLPAVTFTSSWKYSIFGWTGLFLWLILLIGGIVKSFSFRQKIFPFFFGVSLCILFYMIFHSFYGVVENVSERGGVEYFEFTGNFTFLVFIFISHYSISHKLPVRLSLLSLAVLFGYNNLMVVKYILGVYK